MSQGLNHVPLIDGNPRRGEKQVDDAGAKFVNIIPAEAVRYRIRTGVERVFGMLKDSHGGCTVRVRGHEKVLQLPLKKAHISRQALKCVAFWPPWRTAASGATCEFRGFRREPTNPRSAAQRHNHTYPPETALSDGYLTTHRAPQGKMGKVQQSSCRALGERSGFGGASTARGS